MLIIFEFLPKTLKIRVRTEMKNRIIIVRGEKSLHTEQEIQELYRFLTFVGGNYRNALYVECIDGNGYMLATDNDAKQVLYPIQQFHDLTGDILSPDEMIGTLSRQAFECLYSKWLLWNTDDKCKCGICEMYRLQKRNGGV